MPRLGRSQPNRPYVHRGAHQVADPTPVHQSHTALTETGGLTSLSFTAPAGLATDDVVVVQIHKNPSAAITPPTGFTQKSQVTNTSQQHTVFWGRRGGGADIGAGPYVFTWTGATFAGGSAHRISGCVATGDPFDVVDHEFSNTGATSTPAVQATTVTDNTLLLWMANGFNNATVWTPPAGFTKVFEQNNLTAARLNDPAAGDTGALTGSTATADVKIAFLGAVQPAPPSAGTDANAESAAVAVTGADALVDLAPAAGAASVPAAAAAASAASTVDAGSATVPFAAADATAVNLVTVDAGTASVPIAAADATTDAQVSAGTASVPITSQDAAAALTVNAGAASVPFTAADAAVSTATQTNADAGTASVPIAAADASVDTTISAGAASVPAAAADAVGRVEANPAAAEVPIRAGNDPDLYADGFDLPALPALTVTASTASVPVTAADATISTATFTNADAQAASVPIAAADASVALTVTAGAASVPIAAVDAQAVNLVTAAAGSPSVPVSAADASVAITSDAGAASVPVAAAGPGWGIGAGTATVPATAADAIAALAATAAAAASVSLVAAQAEAFIPPPVPPPRWVEGATAATAQLEGTTAGTGEVEGVLVGVGIVEGASSL